MVGRVEEEEGKGGGKSARKQSGGVPSGCDERETQNLDSDGEEEEAGSRHSMFEANVEKIDTRVCRGWGQGGGMVEETMSLQEKGWERHSRKGMSHHYEYIAPDGKTFENMTAALNYFEGNEDDRKDDGGETASTGGCCDQSEQQNLDSDDGEEEEAGNGYNSVRDWGRTTVEETVTMWEKGWQRQSVRVGDHYEYMSPDGKTFENMSAALRYAQGKEDEKEGDGKEAASAGSLKWL